jgi:hypothetical protein
MRVNLRRAVRVILASLALVGLWAALTVAKAQTQGNLNPYSLSIDRGVKTATAVAGAATLNKGSGVITSEALTTIAGATYVLTVTNSTISGAEMVMSSVQFGTSTTGTPAIATVKVAAGSIVITVQNIAAAAVLNGTLKIAFVSFEN